MQFEMVIQISIEMTSETLEFYRGLILFSSKDNVTIA